MSNYDFTLYHYWRSSCSWRVRWAFALKKIKLHHVPINLLQNEQDSSSYLDKNPSGLVPCLKINTSYMGESLAILEWLEETYQKPSLLPQDAFSRMKVRQLSYTITSGVQPLQNLSVQKKYSHEKTEQLSFARYWIEKGFHVYEDLLQDSLQGFSFGSSTTFADLCLIPQVYNAHRFGVEMEKFPKIRSIYEHCLTTDACNTTAPENYCT